MASITGGGSGWVAFAFGPSVALYNDDTNAYTKLELPDATATAAGAGAGVTAPTPMNDDDKASKDDAGAGGDDDADDTKGSAGSGGNKGPITHHIRAMKFSPCGRYFACGGDDKVISVWRLPGDAKHSVTKPKAAAAAEPEAPHCVAYHAGKKRVAALSFVPGVSPTVLYGDRIGDVYQFVVPAPAQAAAAAAAAVVVPSTNPMGHLAAITELAFVPAVTATATATASDIKSSSAIASSAGAGAGGGSGSGYVLSGDDEAQIRVSAYPNLFDIQSFGLHHRGFITAISVLTGAAGPQPLVVSGGGDSSIVLWNYLTGTKIASHSFDDSAQLSTKTVGPAGAAAAAAAETVKSKLTAANAKTNDSASADAPINPPRKRLSEAVFAVASGADSAPSSVRYISSMDWSSHHKLLAVAVNTVSSVYLFDASLKLIETLPLPANTSGVSLVWSRGVSLYVSVRRNAVATAPGALGVDPLLSVFIPNPNRTPPRFVPCDSKLSASVSALNARFAELLASAPSGADLVGDEYSKREQLKAAKLGDVKLRKDERTANKRARKIRKKENKKAKGKAGKGKASTAAAADSDGDGDGDGDGDDDAAAQDDGGFVVG